MTPHARWDQLIAALQGRLPDVPDAEWDWGGVCRLAQQLGVAPLLHHRLSQRGLAMGIPAASREFLQTAYLHTAMHNTRLYHFLKLVLAPLTDAGIPVMLLKGAYLAKGVYGNIAVRPMGDADIMVPPHCLSHAAQIVEALGYRPDQVISPDRLGDRHHLPRYVHSAGISLEIHGTSNFMHLSSPLGDVELSRIWGDARPWSLDGHAAKVLSPEDQLLHLFLHASAAHRFVIDLRPLFDIALTLDRGGIDWPVFLGRARGWGYQRAVGFTLSICQRWAGAVIPAEVSGLITPDMADPVLINYVRRKIVNAPHERFVLEFFEKGRDEPCFSADLKPFFSRRGYRFRVRRIRDNLLPPTAHNHLTRLVRLSARWCGLLWRCLMGQSVMRTTITPEIHLRRFILKDR